MIEMSGIPVYRGIEIAPAFIHEELKMNIDKIKIDPAEIETEMERFQQLRKQAKKELELLKQKAEDQSREEEKEIFDAHLMMMEDPMLIDKIIHRVKEELLSLEQAIEQTKAEIMAMFLSIEDEYLKARAADVEDVANRFLRLGLGIESRSFEDIKEDIILIAKDLKPSETAGFTSYIKGILLEEGSQTSHAAIMAKAKGIPTIVGLTGIMEAANAGDVMILDAIGNKVFLLPTDETLVRYQEYKEALNHKKKQLEKLRDEDAVTKDGRVIKLYSNIGGSQEMDAVLANGAKGVGLLRTEFIYMNSRNFPTEEEQYKEYKAIVEQGLEDVIIRTLDIGGDKNLPYYEFQEEANPFLGFRALRFTLANEPLFKTQLRAILRASAFGHTSIMFPMVSTLDEIQKAKCLLEICKEELRMEQIAFDPDIRIGIMIEIPAAAVIADLLIQEVDFFSIGTNDLCQYTLAVDRMNKDVAYLYQPLHPSILRLIRQTVDAAHKEQKEVGVCGEMAGEALNAIVLIGLGVDELSMSPAVIPELKALIRRITYEEAKEISNRALQCKKAQEIQELLEQEVKKHDYE